VRNVDLRDQQFIGGDCTNTFNDVISTMRSAFEHTLI